MFICVAGLGKTFPDAGRRPATRTNQSEAARQKLKGHEELAPSGATWSWAVRSSSCWCLGEAATNDAVRDTESACPSGGQALPVCGAKGPEDATHRSLERTRRA